MVRIQRYLIATTCAAALAVSACAPGTQTVDPTTVQTNIAGLVTSVAAITKLACAVAPTGLTIAGILSANPAITTASQIAAVVCGTQFASTTSPAGTRMVRKFGSRRAGAPAPGRLIGSYTGPTGITVPIVVVPAR